MKSGRGRGVGILRSAEGEAKPAAIASMAAIAASPASCRARCLSEKRARNRTGSGVASEQSDSRRLAIVAIGSFVDDMMNQNIAKRKVVNGCNLH